MSLLLNPWAFLLKEYLYVVPESRAILIRRAVRLHLDLVDQTIA